MITVSLVTYHNNQNDIKNVISSVLNTNLPIKFIVSDNSTNKNIEKLCDDERIEYIYNNSNKGFGHGHNIAIKRALDLDSKYHIVINPDIYFDKGTLEKLISFIEEHAEIGLLMPKVLYPTGETQHVCKMLPTPANVFLRGFIPKGIKKFDEYNDQYEMKFTGYNHTMKVPCVSGCFMMFRTKVFKNIGMFDENIFMYFEDFDLSRRVSEKYQTVMYPEAQVYHRWEKATHTSKRFKLITIKSAIYYFNKWGWLFDKKRKNKNRNILKNWKYVEGVKYE